MRPLPHHPTGRTTHTMKAHIYIDFTHIKGNAIINDHLSATYNAQSMVEALERLLKGIKAGDPQLKRGESIVMTTHPTHFMNDHEAQINAMEVQS